MIGPAEGEALRRLAQQIVKALLNEGDIENATHGNYDAETFRIRIGEQWVNTVASILALAPLSGPVDASGEPACSVCQVRTLYACADCRIDFGVSIPVCSKPTCRDEHEQKCSARLRERLAGAAVPSSPDEPICKCGSIMVCPDIGCDENKAVPSSPAQPQMASLVAEVARLRDYVAALGGEKKALELLPGYTPSPAAQDEPQNALQRLKEIFTTYRDAQMPHSGRGGKVEVQTIRKTLEVVVYEIERELSALPPSSPVADMIAIWRDRAAAPSVESADSELAVLRCADELEAALKVKSVCGSVKRN